MIAAHSIPKIIEQHTEDAASLWLIRDNAVRTSSFRLSELIRLDERVEAHIDGLRIAEMNGWVASLNELEDGGAGEFFVAGVLAVEGGDSGRLGQVIERAYARAAKTASESYHRAYDPWRGLVSAVAWVNRAHAAGVIEWLLDTPRPRTRWLGVAACGARRSVRQHGLKAVLADREPMVRARAARTIGELGKTDCRSELNAMLDDPEDDCRFWAAWSAARLGTTEGLRALTEFARSPGAHCDRALDLLLRLLSTEHANAFLRVLAREHGRRRTLIHAAAVVGDALYIPWLATQARNPSTARISGDAFAMITGADLAALGLALPLPADFQAGPSDDPDDENVAIDEDEGLAWPDSEKLGLWWEENKARFDNGTSYFLGLPKRSANWMGALSQAAQHQRRAAALELALRHPEHALFEVRARGNVQRRMISNVGAVT